MPKKSRPRRGSLQFWPRKRAAKPLPSANWKHISSKSQGLLGMIAYKAGMTSVSIKDSTEKIRTSGKQITVPATVLEVPPMKVFSVRFYNNGIPVQDIVVSNDKELKRKLKIPKQLKTLDKTPETFDDIRVIAYSIPKQTSIKKTPDMIELAIQSDNKLEFVKTLINRELTVQDFITPEVSLLDARGLTKGKGNQGPVKRFGIKLKFHKSEKGVRRPGSLAPWHPARVTFRAPMAGQLGMFSRVIYNLKVLDSGNAKESDINPKAGFKNYGKIKTSYIILKGSVQGPAKRQILLTPSFRPTPKMAKKKYEMLEVLNK